MATSSPLLKSSLRPMTRAPYQTYRDQGIFTASPAFLGEDSLYVEGGRVLKQNRASLAREEASAGRTCTLPGHHFTSLSLIKNSLNSTARNRHVAWVPASLPNSIVLLGGSDSATDLTAEIVPGFEKWSSFHLSLLQAEESLICVTVDRLPAGFPTKTRL